MMMMMISLCNPTHVRWDIKEKEIYGNEWNEQKSFLRQVKMSQDTKRTQKNGWGFKFSPFCMFICGIVFFSLLCTIHASFSPFSFFILFYFLRGKNLHLNSFCNGWKSFEYGVSAHCNELSSFSNLSICSDCTQCMCVKLVLLCNCVQFEIRH
jgi:hypothetical protein